jgi:hypothetical protein
MPKLTNNEGILLTLTSNPPRSSFNKVQLLIRELKLAKSDPILTNSHFQWLLQVNLGYQAFEVERPRL